MNKSASLVLTLLCVSCLLITNHASAYDTKTGHTPLTELAFKAYQNCFPDDTAFSTENRELVLRGNRAMDDGMHIQIPLQYWDVEGVPGLFEKTVRVFNWHFYNPEKADPKITRRFLVEQSQRRLWKRAEYGFKTME